MGKHVDGFVCDGTCDVCVEYAVTGVPKGFASACAVGPTDASDMKCNFRSTTSKASHEEPGTYYTKYGSYCYGSCTCACILHESE